MIFADNQSQTNQESIKSGISNYSVITDQVADNLHDLTLIADHQSKDLSKKINEAENAVRKATIILAKLQEEL